MSNAQDELEALKLADSSTYACQAASSSMLDTSVSRILLQPGSGKAALHCGKLRYLSLFPDQNGKIGLCDMQCPLKGNYCVLEPKQDPVAHL